MIYIQKLGDDRINFSKASRDELDHIIRAHCAQVSTQSYEVLARDLCLHQTRKSNVRFITFLSWLLYPFYQLPFYPEKEEMRSFEVFILPPSPLPRLSAPYLFPHPLVFTFIFTVTLGNSGTSLCEYYFYCGEKCEQYFKFCIVSYIIHYFECHFYFGLLFIFFEINFIISFNFHYVLFNKE